MKQRFAFSNEFLRFHIVLYKIRDYLFRKWFYNFNGIDEDFNIGTINVGLVSGFSGHKNVLSFSYLNNKFSFIKK